MADSMNAAFARSEELKQEWAKLRCEVDALKSDNKHDVTRRNAIQARMAQITVDMSAVLSETRKLIPTPDIDDDETGKSIGQMDDEHAFIQYSKNHLHVIQRTYHSSDEEEEEELATFGDEDVPEAPFPGDFDSGAGFDIDEFTSDKGGSMKKEKKPATARRREMTNGLKDRSGEITDPSHTAELSDSELARKDTEKLTLHGSSGSLVDNGKGFSKGISRVARKVNRKMDRKQTAELKIAERAEKKDQKGNSSATEASQNAEKEKKASKSKRRWKTFEGVTSFRMLAKNLKGSGKRKDKEEEQEQPKEVRRKEGLNGTKGGGGNAFAEMGERVTQRGEKLTGAAEGSERMADDAGDMLAAVRALKQKNQKRGFFS